MTNLQYEEFNNQKKDKKVFLTFGANIFFVFNQKSSSASKIILIERENVSVKVERRKRTFEWIRGSQLFLSDWLLRGELKRTGRYWLISTPAL